MEGKIDDVLDTERLDVGELFLSRLAGRGDPVVEATPVVDAFGIGHGLRYFSS